MKKVTVSLSAETAASLLLSEVKKRTPDVDLCLSLIAQIDDMPAVFNKGGISPVHWSAILGHDQIVSAFLDSGIDVNHKYISKNESSILFCSILGARESIARELIGRGADVSVGNKGYSPLHAACRFGSIEIADMLLDAGANIDALDKQYQNPPLFYAFLYDNQKIRDHLISRGANQNLITTPVSKFAEWTSRNLNFCEKLTPLQKLLVKEYAHSQFQLAGAWGDIGRGTPMSFLLDSASNEECKNISDLRQLLNDMLDDMILIE